MDEPKSKTLNSQQWLRAAEAVIDIEKHRYQFTSSDQDTGAEKTSGTKQQATALSDLSSLKGSASSSAVAFPKSKLTAVPQDKSTPPSTGSAATVYTLPFHKRED